jgi:hypothetical protein
MRARHCACQLSMPFGSSKLIIFNAKHFSRNFHKHNLSCLNICCRQ